MAGVIKDVAMLGSYQEMEVDFTADRPGLSLFHCHMQMHMDFGLMALSSTPAERPSAWQPERVKMRINCICIANASHLQT